MVAEVPVMPTPTVLPTVSPKAQVVSADQTHDTGRASHSRGEGSQMDVQSITVGGVATLELRMRTPQSASTVTQMSENCPTLLLMELRPTRR